MACEELLRALEAIDSALAEAVTSFDQVMAQPASYERGREVAAIVERIDSTRRCALDAIANHQCPDALEALKGIMDCHIRSITDEAWAEGRRVVDSYRDCPLCGKPSDDGDVHQDCADYEAMCADAIPAEDAAEAVEPRHGY